ncbi:hypothetical protein ABT158_49005 [Nonomuraea sp. NPDC001636]|uniref:hypothetical protein n=1 Tax=Nonomuraea sp. NPDC001636 TaxID=3154391 RepID=UPI0033310A53
MAKVPDGGEHIGVSRSPAAVLATVALMATVALVRRALNPADQVNLADLAAVAIAPALAAATVVTWAKRRNSADGRSAAKRSQCQRGGRAHGTHARHQQPQSATDRSP